MKGRVMGGGKRRGHMKIEGGRILLRKMNKLSPELREEIVKAVRKNTEDGERVLKTLAPVGKTGETRRRIDTAYHNAGMTGEIVVINSNAARELKDEAYSVNYGRDATAQTGHMSGFGHVGQTEAYLAKRWKGRLGRAVRKAAKQVARSNG